MNMKILLLVLLAASVLLLGCAGKKQQDVTQGPPEVSAPADGQPAMPPSGEPPAAEPAGDAGELADLFQIDTDKPISDEGFDVSTPSSD